MSASSSSGPKMKINLRVWRQKSKNEPGKLENHTLNDVSPDMSFLEMLDVLNNRLIAQGQEAIAFDHDCREGICGSCSLVIDGKAHGPNLETTTCQLHMRSYHDGASITVEPFRANARSSIFPGPKRRGSRASTSRRRTRRHCWSGSGLALKTTERMPG